jgi:hypothetical protein
LSGPGTKPDYCLQDSSCDKLSTVATQLDGIFSCEGVGVSEHHRNNIVDLLVVVVDKATVVRSVGWRCGKRRSPFEAFIGNQEGLLATYTNHADTPFTDWGGDCGNGICFAGPQHVLSRGWLRKGWNVQNRGPTYNLAAKQQSPAGLMAGLLISLFLRLFFQSRQILA